MSFVRVTCRRIKNITGMESFNLTKSQKYRKLENSLIYWAHNNLFNIADCFWNNLTERDKQNYSFRKKFKNVTIRFYKQKLRIDLVNIAGQVCGEVKGICSKRQFLQE